MVKCTSCLLPPQVRLMLVLAPVMCILSGIGVSQVLTTYMKNLDVSRPDKKSKKQQDSTYPIKNEVGGLTDWFRVLLQLLEGDVIYCLLAFCIPLL